MPLAFFDTNVLVYGDDGADPVKQAAAIDLYGRHRKKNSAVVSVQVLQEYFVTVTRKLGLDPRVAQRKVEILARGRVATLNAQDVIAAVELHRLEQLSFWDALIVHAARVSGAEVLYSEDLRHNSTLCGIRVVDPFRGLTRPAL